MSTYFENNVLCCCTFKFICNFGYTPFLLEKQNFILFLNNLCSLQNLYFC